MEFDLKLALAVVIVVIAIAGVVYLVFSPNPFAPSDPDRALYRCVFMCMAAGSEGQDLGQGPCLSSGSPEWDIPDWVCDVAHFPREPVDNEPGNQCPEYGVTAFHFVEVDPECNLIRSV
jgi:hypothetical protein